MADMMVPFIMLLILTIGLILERRYHEEKIVEIYEKKYENWQNNKKQEELIKCKELVGLLFLEDNKLNIEVLDKKIIDRLERKKYTIKG